MPIRRRCHNPHCQRVFQVAPSALADGRGRYCSAACRWADDKLALSTDARFWATVAVCSHGRDCLFCCFAWRGYHDKNGYGFFRLKTAQGWKAISAQRYAWALLNQQAMPPELEARHTCPTLDCVNAMHIRPGSLPPQVRAILRQKIAQGTLYLPGWKDEHDS